MSDSVHKRIHKARGLQLQSQDAEKIAKRDRAAGIRNIFKADVRRLAGSRMPSVTIEMLAPVSGVLGRFVSQDSFMLRDYTNSNLADNRRYRVAEETKGWILKGVDRHHDGGKGDTVQVLDTDILVSDDVRIWRYWLKPFGADENVVGVTDTAGLNIDDFVDTGNIMPQYYQLNISALERASSYIQENI